jgi:hypothetical protein
MFLNFDLFEEAPSCLGSIPQEERYLAKVTAMIVGC